MGYFSFNYNRYIYLPGESSPDNVLTGWYRKYNPAIICDTKQISDLVQEGERSIYTTARKPTHTAR